MIVSQASVPPGAFNRITSLNASPSTQPAEATSPRYGAIYLLPYLILMFCRVSNFGGQAVEGSGDDGTLKIVLEAFAYALGGVLVAVKFIDLRRLLSRFLPFYIYALYAAITASWSGHPDAVLLRVGHMIGLLLVVVAVAMWAQDRRDKFIVVTAVFILICLVMSVGTVILAPSRGLVHPEYIGVGSSRWVGITGHPNILGALSLVGVWCGVTVFGLKKEAALRWLAVSLIILAAVALRGSDSRSSAVCSLVCAGIFYLMSGATAATALQVFTRRFLVLSGIISVILAAAFLVNADFLISHLAPSARGGAGDALSDRPLIWALGFEAIRDNPFGWSWDLLGSYWDLHGKMVFFPHFHNGFLDVAVKGGFVGESLMLAMLFRMAVSIKKLMQQDFALAAVYLSFFACNLLYNLIDTGFDREALLWPMMMATWAVVEAMLIANENVPRRALEPPPSASRAEASRAPSFATASTGKKV